MSRHKYISYIKSLQNIVIYFLHKAIYFLHEVIYFLHKVIYFLESLIHEVTK
jgi:hypothetical protein